MKKNQRAIRLTIAAFMIVFGLMSLSQAGYFVIRYQVLKEALDAHSISQFTTSAWRCYWLFFGAYLLQLSWREIVLRKGLLFSVVASLAVCITTMMLYGFN